MYKELENYIGELVTYKAICEILNIPYKTSNSKTKQLNEIQRYYKLEKVKTKFKIVERYQNPLPYIDNRQSGYYNDLEIIILYALQNSNKTNNIWSTTEALIVANLVNNNYKLGNRNRELTAGAMEVDIDYLNTFYQHTRSRFKDIFESALKRMSNKKLIDYIEITMTYKRVANIELNELNKPVIDDAGCIQYKTTKVYKQATPEERESILAIENQVLKEMNYVTVSDIIRDGKYNKYRIRVDSMVKEKLNIEYYYNAYSIVHLKDEVKKEIQQLERMESINALNALKLNSLNNSTDKYLNKDIDNKELCIDILVNSYTPYRLQTLINNYLKAIKEDDLPF